MTMTRRQFGAGIAAVSASAALPSTVIADDIIDIEFYSQCDNAVLTVTHYEISHSVRIWKQLLATREESLAWTGRKALFSASLRDIAFIRDWAIPFYSERERRERPIIRSILRRRGWVYDAASDSFSQTNGAGFARLMLDENPVIEAMFKERGMVYVPTTRSFRHVEQLRNS